MNPQMKSLQDVRGLAGGELSLKARLGYVALLLVSTAMSGVIASLWLTEGFLPLRTQAAFGAMSVIGASWVGLSIWALKARRPLYARDRVIAGRMAVAFTALFLAGAIAGVFMAGTPAAYAAVATGVALFGMAIGALVSARRRFAELTARREQLSH
jgi:hypothetical protein